MYECVYVHSTFQNCIIGRHSSKVEMFVLQCPSTFYFLHFFQGTLLLLLALSSAIKHNGEGNVGQCKYKRYLDPRPHSVSILEFGAVGDGKTLNTVAFQNTIFYLKSFADKGGAQLYVPTGRWLTGSFNLTSHLTLFLERGATILASEVLNLTLITFFM